MVVGRELMCGVAFGTSRYAAFDTLTSAHTSDSSFFASRRKKGAADWPHGEDGEVRRQVEGTVEMVCACEHSDDLHVTNLSARLPVTQRRPHRHRLALGASYVARTRPLATEGCDEVLCVCVCVCV